MENKRKISLLIPYRSKDGIVLVYLQKRSKDAKRLPDYFGFWGGGIEEGESSEQALIREMKEELNFVPTGYEYFRNFEFDKNIRDIFILKTDINFEKKTTVLEGEYGKWFSETEIANESKLIAEDKLVLKEFYKNLQVRNRSNK